MTLLFFDTYYIDGKESVLGLYTIAKDFIVPSLAIIVPVAITWYITSHDRRINAKNRADDLRRSDDDRKELILTEVKKRKEHEERILSDFQFFFESMANILNSHLQTLDNIIEKCTVDKLPTLSVAVFTNKHLHALDNLDIKILAGFFERSQFAQYITSVELIKDLYKQLDITIEDYKIKTEELTDEIDVNLFSLFIELDTLVLDGSFDKKVLANLLKFREEYFEYAENYDSEKDVAVPAYISENKTMFKDDDYLKITLSHPHIKDFVTKMEISVAKIDRLCRSKQVAFSKIRIGFLQHTTILSQISKNVKK